MRLPGAAAKLRSTLSRAANLKLEKLCLGSRNIVGASAVAPRRWRRIFPRRGRRPRPVFKTPFGARIVANVEARFAKAAHGRFGTSQKKIVRLPKAREKMRIVARLARLFPCVKSAKVRGRNFTPAVGCADLATVDAGGIVKTAFFDDGSRGRIVAHHDARTQKKRSQKNKTFEERFFHHFPFGKNQYSASDFRSRLISSPMMSAGFLSLKRTS